MVNRNNQLEEKSKLLQIPKLDELEKIKLQNIMLRLALEGEKIKNLENEIRISKGEIIKQEGNLNIWKNKFNLKLKEYNISIEEVDINAETGEVNILSKDR